MSNKLHKTLIVFLVLSVFLNIYLLFFNPIPKILKERIDELELEGVEKKEIIEFQQREIDSVLAIPLPKPIIIKEKIYKDINKEYPNHNSLSNDSIVELWIKLSNEE